MSKKVAEGGGKVGEQAKTDSYQISMDECGTLVRPASKVLKCTCLHTTAGVCRCNLSRSNSQPVIVVEPINDESLRCDCRNCQFLSGWCCTPLLCFVLLLVIMVSWFNFPFKGEDGERSVVDDATINKTSNATLYGSSADLKVLETSSLSTAPNWPY